MKYAIGVDVGGTNMKCVAVRADGNLIETRTFPTGDLANTWRVSIREAVNQLEQTHGCAGAVGVSSPGLAAADGRSIAWMRGRMEGVEGFDFTAHLQRREPVAVMNDAHAALLGEAWIGAARGCENAVLLTLGTGVGGAILCDGRILKGHLGRAGHLGHMTLDADGEGDLINTPGSLEDAIGDHSIKRRTEGRFDSTAGLVAAVASGDALAIKHWSKSIHRLAVAIASIINITDPQKVVLSGGITRAGDLLLQPLNNELDRFEWRPTNQRVSIVFATLGDLAGAYGAAKNAIERSAI